MMSGSDLETSIDIWEETARDLLRIDSSKDTRTVIEKHTNTIHTVLENKLSEVGVHFALTLRQLWTYVYWD